MKRKESNWQKAKKEYEQLKKEGRLDEIDSIPDVIHKSAEAVATKMLVNTRIKKPESVKG